MKRETNGHRGKQLLLVSLVTMGIPYVDLNLHQLAPDPSQFSIMCSFSAFAPSERWRCSNSNDSPFYLPTRKPPLTHI